HISFEASSICSNPSCCPVVSSIAISLVHPVPRKLTADFSLQRARFARRGVLVLVMGNLWYLGPLVDAVAP
ncbi:hypothetical protein PFISCL1PPCAC_20511, partial [Pristionchus fissidentatus]